MAKRKWWFPLAWGGFLALLSFVPHLIAYLRTPEGYQYMQTLYPIWGDANSYWSWMKQAAEGNYLFSFLYTSEPHLSALFHPVFLGMGMLISLGIPGTLVWYGVDMLAAVSAGVVTYFFVSYFMHPITLRRLATLLITGGGGFGFLLFFVPTLFTGGTLPADVGAMEATMARSIASPFILEISVVLMLTAFMCFIRYLETDAKKSLIFAICAGLLLNSIHPYDALVVTVVLTVYTLTAGYHKKFFSLVVFLAISLLPIAYHFILSAIDPVFGAHSNYPLSSPYPISFILGFGVIGVFALLTILKRFVAHTGTEIPRFSFLITWLAVVPFLLYLPLSFQRRQIIGSIVPVGILALYGLRDTWRFLFERLSANMRKPIRVVMQVTFTCLIVGLAFGTPIMLFIRDIASLRPEFPFYLSQPTLDATAWLDTNTDRSQVILASPDMGNFIPRLTGNVVYRGHAAQTVREPEKTAETLEFFSPATPMLQREQFLREKGIDIVFYGSEEQKIGVIDFTNSENLTLVYHNSEVQVYSVRR